jgi:DICT domain-containing protein
MTKINITTRDNGSFTSYRANGITVPNELIEIDPALPAGTEGKLFVFAEKLEAWRIEESAKQAAKKAGLAARNAAYAARKQNVQFNEREEMI